MFMCQRDSFLQELDTEIVTCEPITDLNGISSLSIDPKDLDGVSLFKIVLSDTVFFPEGGGQPDDKGTITNRASPTSTSKGEVIRVVRNGTVAEHYVTFPKEMDVETSWKAGDKVSTKINWQRRFDHMQQHSGQHLITAIADTMFGFPTTSWWLGAKESYIELGTKEVSADQMRSIEEEVNAKIRDNVSVQVDVVELDDPKLKTARGRNLPEDVKGNIRIVSMLGVESNVCCGTHVRNLSQLQIIKLLHVVKKKGKCLLHFLCGDRAFLRFTSMLQREEKLVEILKSSPSDLPKAGEKLNLALKTARKSNQMLSKDLVVFIAQQFRECGRDKLWMYHRENVDLDFGMAILREIGTDIKTSTILITLKTEGTSGYFLLAGDEKTISKEKLQDTGLELCRIFDGKGSLQKGNIFQGKFSKINEVKIQKLAQQLLNDSENKTWSDIQVV